MVLGGGRILPARRPTLRFRPVQRELPLRRRKTLMNQQPWFIKNRETRPKKRQNLITFRQDLMQKRENLMKNP